MDEPNDFYVSLSNDGKTYVIMQPGEQVYVDLWDVTPSGLDMARRICDMLNEYSVPRRASS